MNKGFIQAVYKMRNSLKGLIVQTPFIPSTLSTKNNTLFLKCENLQYTHSFKYRGALAALLQYQQNDKLVWETILREGIITCSTGNFAKSLAYITATIGVKLTVVVHEWVDKKKVESIQKINPKTIIIKMSVEDWKDIVN
ncbi:MAG: eutB [Francisellaceae bacterium]|nr:eutB [Francisellaceae bacterium]